MPIIDMMSCSVKAISLRCTEATITGLPFDMVLPFDNLVLQAQICNVSPNSFFGIFVLPLWTTDMNF